MSEDEREIRALVATWMEETCAGNHERVLGLMSDEAVFLVPGAEPFGKAAFGAASQAMQGVVFEGTNEIHELEILGEVALLRSYIEVAVTPPGAATRRQAGYTLTVLRKEDDGRWRLYRDANLLTPRS